MLVEKSDYIGFTDEEKRQAIAQLIWESDKWGTERKEELLAYFTKISTDRA